MALSAKKDLQRRQRRWAESAGIEIDARGYLRDHAANFRVPLSGPTLAAFERGSELEPRRTQPARIAALHSSAALVANVFDHWSARDASPLAAALGGAREPVAVSFEEPFATGVEGDPPLVDVVLRATSGRCVAIESKFCEWLTRRPPNKAQFKPKYFPGRALWAAEGLPRCQRLADGLQSGAQRFKYLHAAQLLKHALGLARAVPAKFELRYLYYDWPGRQSVAHRDEIAQFAASVAADIVFEASTYQQLYAALRSDAGVDAGYLEYLRSRYFSDMRAG